MNIIYVLTTVEGYTHSSATILPSRDKCTFDWQCVMLVFFLKIVLFFCALTLRWSKKCASKFVIEFNVQSEAVINQQNFHT